MKTLLFILAWTIGLNNFAQQQCPIIPTPLDYEVFKGELNISKGLSLNDSSMPLQSFKLLREELSTQFNIALNEVEKRPKILLKREVNASKDYYSITIDKDIEIVYSSDASCFYAVNSLLQLIEGERVKWYLKKSKVVDSPKFEWRGLHLDVSRHFFSVDEVKKFIRIMAMYKFNTFHWHLTDDQGWRIEIKKYPKLTEVGAYRDSTVDGHYSRSPRTYTVKKYGGFYTQEEIKELVAYAQSKYITIVPEIEMPGHSRAALAAYPELSCSGLENPVPGLWGVFDDIYCSKEESILFMQNVLEEVVEMFPSEYIHIGGDEAPKTRWKSCSNCQDVIDSNGLKDDHELQSYFIKRIDQFLIKKGKKLIGWDEILEGGLSPNAAVMSWRGDQGGKEAASQGHAVVMSPNTHCYFDYYQSSHPDEPLAIGGYLPLEKVYQFNPIPEGMSAIDAAFVLGGQANLWSEYMSEMSQVEYMTYPRALALIQSLWCFSKPSYTEFLNVYLLKHEDYLKKHAVNYAKSIHFPQMNIRRAEGGINLNFTGAYEASKFEVLLEQSKDNLNRTLYYPNLGSQDSIFISKAIDSKRSDLNVKVNSIPNAVEVNYNFVITDNLGANVELITPAHPKYNNNGSLNLVDGICGKTPWKGSEWLGFNTSQIVFIIDLEQKKKLRGFRIGFLEDNGSWIYLPKKIKLFKSKDKVNWEKLREADLNACDSQFGMKELRLKSKARYVKVEVSAMDLIPEGNDGAGHVPWTFIDEIELF
ncbi:MAG: family 20 glycosylhydrolase [Crocinitomicaceae bacterium]|nr:family 20 glycosylhydrolase [Crocinitomicaceae bacterium]